MKKKIPTSSLVDLVAGRLTPDEARRLLEQIEKDPEASAALDDVVEIRTLMQREGGSLFPRPSRVAAATAPVRSAVRWALDGMRSWDWRPIIVLGTILLLVGGSVWVTSIRPPSVAIVASVRDDELQLLSRGMEEKESDLVRNLFAQGSYEDGIHLAEWYLAAFPHASDAGTMHLLAGMGWMRVSERTVLGLRAGYRAVQLEKAIVHLQESAAAGGTQSEDAAWLLARAYILHADLEKAGPLLERIVLEGGRHAPEAVRLLDGLGGLPSSL